MNDPYEIKPTNFNKPDGSENQKPLINCPRCGAYMINACRIPCPKCGYTMECSS
jgi:ribosomal protein L37E